MTAQQKRLLTADKSKLTKLDPFELASRLRTTPSSWSSLPLATRQKLYSLLPAPLEGEAAHDVEVNPLMTKYRVYIEEELGEWHADLKGGLEAKKWRASALEAGRVRKEGGWEAWKEDARKEYWGDESENAMKQETPKENDGKARVDDDGVKVAESVEEGSVKDEKGISGEKLVESGGEASGKLHEGSTTALEAS